MAKKKEEKLSIKELKHQARRYSIKEGIFSYAKGAVGGRYIAPFAIAINTSNSLVAMLSSVSGLLGPLSQIFGSKLIEKHSRKKILLTMVFFEALMWLPFIIIAFLFYKGIITNFLPLFLLLFFAIYIIIANSGHPAWFSWMGDIVNKKHRGRFFSKRNLILGFVGGLIALAASFFLDWFKKNEWTMYGFMILFALAITFEIFRWKGFKKQYEPKLKLKRGYYFSFWQFLKKAPKTNFGKFSLFRFFLHLANFISAPLLVVYLLRHLEFKYSTYMIVTLAGAAFTFLVIELWGKFSDKYGNYRTLAITSIFIPLIPILWILHPSPVYMVLVPAAIGGISWAGFTLAEGNFIYDNVEQSKRGIIASYHAMLGGIGIFIGAGIGALLIKFLNTSFIEPLFFIFILGSIVRMIVVFFWMPRLKEIRKVKKLRGFKDLENMVLKEGKPTLIEEVHEILHIKDYLRMK